MYHHLYVALVAVYGFIAAAGVISGLLRRRMLLLRGRGLFLLSAVAAIVVAMLQPDLTAAALVVPIVTFWGRRHWLILRFAPERFRAVIEDALNMLLIPGSRTEDGYLLKLRDGPARLRLHAGLWTIAILRFQAPQPNKKLDLLRALLWKKFDPLFPRPRIHLG